MTEEPSAKKVAARKLMFAAFCEGVAILAGLFAYIVTANWMWLVIGAVGGMAFTLPAIIVFVRASMEERDRASR